MSEHEEFRFDTGEAWLDLLGTRRSSWTSTLVDRLTGPDSFARWLRAVYSNHHIAPEPTEADVSAARELREALRAVTAVVLGLPEATGAPTPAQALATVNRYAAQSIPPRTQWDGRRLVPAQQLRPDGALAALAAQGLARLTEGPHVLRSCLDEGCRKIYLDDRGSRKYCCTTCSGRARVRAFRERASGEE